MSRRSAEALEAEQFGYSDSSWASVPEKDRELLRLIRPLPRARSEGNHMFGHLEKTLTDLEASVKSMGGTFDLNPDFQRGHVWTRQQQVAFMENVFRGSAPLRFKFNCPSYGSREVNDPGMTRHDFVCIDGLQRLTAIRQFMAGEYPVFGDKFAEDFRGTTFDPFRLGMTCVFEVYEFVSRKELLQFYVDLNSGGTVHAPEELDRVRGLLREAAEPMYAPPAPSKATPAKRSRSR